jgi:hypothetical protein
MSDALELFAFWAPLVGILALSVPHYMSHAKLLGLLRKRHLALWEGLGKPTLLGALTSLGLEWSVWGRGAHGTYVGWLWRAGYARLDDGDVAALGSKLIRQTWVAIGLLVGWAAISVAIGRLRFGR